jgi:Pentapeptide repeats (8 copies)
MKQTKRSTKATNNNPELTTKNVNDSLFWKWYPYIVKILVAFFFSPLWMPLIVLPIVFLYTVFGSLFITILAMLVAFYLIWFVPNKQVERLRDKTTNDSESEFDKERDILKLTDDTRKTMAQIVGGIVLVGSFGAAYYTYELTKVRMYSERYSEAIKLLEKDNDMSIRLGGLFELDNIADESERLRPAIYKVLLNYVKERSFEITDYKECKIKNDKDGNIRGNDDILVATKIILERTKSEILDSNLDFSNAMLNNGKFNGVDFSKGTSFESTCFVGAKLQFADLSGITNFTNAQFFNADLTNANFKDSDLSKALNIKKEYIVNINDKTQVNQELQKTKEERLNTISKESESPQNFSK